MNKSQLEEKDIEAEYGPNWAAVENVARIARGMTKEQRNRLQAAWNATWYDAWFAGQDVALTLSLGAARKAAFITVRNADADAAWTAARDARQDAGRTAMWRAALDFAGGVAYAVCIKDLICQHGFTQYDYDTMTSAWIEVFGDPFDAAKIADADLGSHSFDDQFSGTEGIVLEEAEKRQRFIVDEVSITYRQTVDITGVEARVNRPQGTVGKRFEHVIEVNAEHGYRLLNWQLATTSVDPSVDSVATEASITETIVGVFEDERRDGDGGQCTVLTGR